MNLELPDTPLVREARRMIEVVAPAPIFQHIVRTFLMGRAFGVARGIAFDEEDLCLATLLHDLGLCRGHVDTCGPFPRVGSRAARTLLEERGAAPKRIPAIADAIDFHMQLFPR